jgi:carbonic anhydrase/acetyltransferase-like protein (isoleucine patch superfamily)
MIKSFEGKTPKIAASAFVSEAAYVVGDVEIGENSSVWPGAVVRGDSGRVIIGKYTAVEDNCVIHCGAPPNADIIIGDMVHVGHGAVINCRKIGNNVLIGMNSTILHEVEIGNMCIIGAGCLVSQGMKVPDNSFVVGVPAEIKGKVTEKQHFWIKEAPLGYAKLGERFKKDGL